MDGFLDTHERRMLRDSVAAFLSAPVAGRSLRDEWQAFGALGLLAIGFDEADGGVEGGPVERMIVMNEIGRTLRPVDYATSHILAAELIGRAPAGSVRGPMPGLVDGTTLVGTDLACVMSGRSPRLAVLASEAPRLRGRADLVSVGAQADWLIVTAGEGGEAIGHYLVDARHACVVRTPVASIDGHDIADVVLNDCPATRLCGAVEAQAAYDQVCAGLSAEVVGLMQQLVSRTVGHVKTRTQFGRPLSAFQALQHRLVEAHVVVEEAHSLSFLAAEALAARRPEAGSLAVAAAFKALRHAMVVGREAIQMHGAIGMAEEAGIGACYRRILAIGALLGSADRQLEIFAQRRRALQQQGDDHDRRIR